MSLQYSKKIYQKITEVNSSMCLGIDPHIHGLPDFMSSLLENKGAEFFLEWFGESHIEAAVKKQLPAVKFQAAFFEAHGYKGHHVLERLIKKANKESLVTILDAKRGDISSTMEAYGVGAFDVMKADCLTITPYMGFDVISPLERWLKDGKGAYVVWMSSNPSGHEIQGLIDSHGISCAERLFDNIESMALQSGYADAIGYVMGATKISGLDQALFDKIKGKPQLMPGVGAQGADTRHPRLKELLGMNLHLVPVSRAVSGYGKGYSNPKLHTVTEKNYAEFLGGNIEGLKIELCPAT